MPERPVQAFKKLSDDAAAALRENNALFMFGHGSIDVVCGTRISAFADVDFTNEIVFCGSCRSAQPYNSDRFGVKQSQEGKRFAFHVVDNGGVLMLAHMGDCGGFPAIFPMAELVLSGKTSGEAYQRLLNGLLRYRSMQPRCERSASAREGEPSLTKRISEF